MDKTDWRRRNLARLAAERARLLWQLLGLDEEALTTLPIFDDGNWTAKDLLAHIAAWDEVATKRVELVLAGRADEIVIFTGADEEARNAAFYAERKDWTLARAVEALQAARAGFLTAIDGLPHEAFDRVYRLPGGEVSVREWAEWRARHDAAHAADLATWRKRRRLENEAGPKQILLAGLAAAREELLAAATLILPEECASRPVCGEWTLKDVLAHVADWEWLGVEGLRMMAAGRQPRVENVEDIDAWNQIHYEARRDLPWEQVWSDLRAAREAMLDALGRMSQADLVRSFAFPWGGEGAVYRWAVVYVAHDREHAAGLQDVVGNGIALQ